MKIYVTHSSAFDYINELYLPIRNSILNSHHEIILPHENSTDQFDSKSILKDCDLVIAEVSYPSTGQGIELGWADFYKIPIVCIYKNGANFSNSLKIISSDFISYENDKDMIEKLANYLSSILRHFPRQ